VSRNTRVESVVPEHDTTHGCCRGESLEALFGMAHEKSEQCVSSGLGLVLFSVSFSFSVSVSVSFSLRWWNKKNLCESISQRGSVVQFFCRATPQSVGTAPPLRIGRIVPSHSHSMSWLYHCIGLHCISLYCIALDWIGFHWIRIHSSIDSVVHGFFFSIHSCIHLCIHPLIHSSTHPLMHPLMHSSTRSSIHSSIHPSISLRIISSSSSSIICL